MSQLITSRRGFIAGLASLVVAAPAVVRAASLMPVRAIIVPTPKMQSLVGWGHLPSERIREIAEMLSQTNEILDDLTFIDQTTFQPVQILRHEIRAIG